MLYTTIQHKLFLGSGEEDFWEFSGTELFEQIGNTLKTEGPMRNLVKITQEVSIKKTFKNYTILYMCIAQGQGQLTPRG